MTYICSAPSKYLNVIHCTLYIAKIIAQNKVYMDCTKEIFYCHPLSTENIALAPGIRGFFHKYLSAERLKPSNLVFVLSNVALMPCMIPYMRVVVNAQQQKTFIRQGD